MIFHDDYAQVPPDQVERFVASQELGRLVTAGADGPHIGLYPFAYGASGLPHVPEPSPGRCHGRHTGVRSPRCGPRPQRHLARRS